jgi:hypothetical protein
VSGLFLQGCILAIETKASNSKVQRKERISLVHDEILLVYKYPKVILECDISCANLSFSHSWPGLGKFMRST